jgi:hypothetical protein
MVRIRQQNGDVTEADRLHAVEILSSEGRLAAVITQDSRGAVRLSYPGDLLFNGYCRMHALKPSKVHRHDSAALLDV